MTAESPGLDAKLDDAVREIMVSFHAQIAEHARQIPTREALVDESLSISFGELPALIGKYRCCLLEAGITPGATAGLAVRREIPHLLVSLALFDLQAHQVTLPSHETESYRSGLIERLDVSHLLRLDDDMDPREPRTGAFHLLRRDGPPRPATARRPATIYSTTSGTTKGPRIIATTEAIMGARADRHDGIHSQRVLVTASVEHSTVKRRRLRCLFVGSPSLFRQNARSSWPDVADFVASKQATVIQLSPVDANRFANNPGRAPLLQVPIYIAGTRISWALRKAMQKNLSAKLYVRYGASECGSIAVAGPGEHDERETVGKPQDGVTVEIIDNNGKPLPAGKVGEIRVKATGIIASYHDDPAESAARFRGGWFHPGDMGMISEDGQLILQGRKDDMMILNSINIYPSEIERVLETHPEVSSAAAFPIKSRIHGDIPAVAVELRRGSAITENALMDFSRDRLGLRYPRKIFFVDGMPRGRTGKILKNELAALVSPAP